MNSLKKVYSSAPDYILLFVLAALLSVGFIMIFSSSPTLGMRFGDSFYYLRRHLVFLLFGVVALFFGYKIDYHHLKKWAFWVLLLTISLLFMLFIPGIGKSVGGAVRWIDTSLFTFQPSEIAKLSVIIFLATMFSSGGQSNSPARLIFFSLIPVALISLLILRQPDLGTTLVILGVTFIMLFVAGLNTKYLFFTGGFLGLIILILSFTSAYRFRRLIAFVDPWKTRFDVGFHIVQSLMAIGSGGLFGLGLGGSKQKFFYLPQHYTDFIFSVLSEELGFLGAFGVVMLFLLFIVRGIRIAMLSKDNFGSLLASGIISWIAIQVIINLYVVTGLFPTTGIPLPFISFGGTALVVSMFSVGVLLNISKGITT